MMSRRTALAAIITTLVAGCAGDDGGDGGETPTDGQGGTPSDATDSPATMTDGAGTTMTLSSPAIEAGEEIPERFTADGADISPPLTIQDVPDEAKSLAIVVDDPDAPSGSFVHWLLWNLAPDTTEIHEDVPRNEQVDSLGAVQGTNDFGEVGYRGPAPPEGDDSHRYRFTASAVDAELAVDPGAERPALRDAMDGHVVGRAAFEATYGR